jgi:hypothetical protein
MGTKYLTSSDSDFLKKIIDIKNPIKILKTVMTKG